MEINDKFIARIHAIAASSHANDFEITALDVDDHDFVDDIVEALEGGNEDGVITLGGVKFRLYTRTSLGVIHVRLNRLDKESVKGLNRGPSPKQKTTSLEDYIQWWQDGLEKRKIPLIPRPPAIITTKTRYY